MDEAKGLLARLNGHYGSTYEPGGRLTLRGGKLFLYTGGDTSLKTEWVGLHVANEDLSLTIEGAQLFGATASKNSVEITKEQARMYYEGDDLPSQASAGPVILTTDERIVGPGLQADAGIRNILPRSRLTRRRP